MIAAFWASFPRTSHTESEQIIKNQTDKIIQGKTSIIIAHRLSAILNADRIIMMKDGKILETGTHEELISKNGTYRELYESQFLAQEQGEIAELY